MRAVTAYIAALLLLACARDGGRTNGSAPPFNANAFITSTMQNAAADADIAVLATKRGWLPETRELGAMIDRAQSEMRADLARLAQRRKLAIPAVMEEKKVALKENLQILLPLTFDRAYAFAMLQALNTTLRNFDVAGRSDDGELRQFVHRWRDRLVEQQRAAHAVVKRIGTPWAGVAAD